jgi:hypothetical protein
MPNRQFRVHFADGAFNYRTNSAGFRGNGEFELHKEAGTKRILVFGDSFTEGGCVADGQRYSDVLRDRLGCEIYNFGISGTGTDQQYLIYREIARKYDHDLIVVGIWVENIRRNASQSRIHGDQNGRHLLTAKPYFSLDDSGSLVLHNQPVPRPVEIRDVPLDDLDTVDPGTRARSGLRDFIAEGVTRLGPGPKRLAQRLSRWQPMPEYDDPNGVAWTLTHRILEQWSSEAEVPLVVVPIPVYQYIEKSASSEAMRARFKELHAPPQLLVHDPLPDFWTYSSTERRQFRFAQDHHFTPAGHLALATSMEPILRRALGSEAELLGGRMEGVSGP